ncbi:hypothetical protein HHK36_007614 [Tetracentron sinense]|uniref:Bidirectional sugar transporter SWEET n=1 Tax=Tetracentron sinense TaxID=13715 RepID=A0A834ZK34_TETSI|nr:hypothetical protein HHK36_007614 [Tetracentron sinense]
MPVRLPLETYVDSSELKILVQSLRPFFFFLMFLFLFWGGNIISFMVYLAPLPTFYRVYKKKSTEGFHSLPYVVALFSSMLWIYYAFLKSDAYLLITINSIGCIIETIYISMYIAYAPKQARILTVKLLLLLNLGLFCLILLITLFLAKGSNRLRILGWVCVVLSASVFAAPLSIMRLVILTKSVEFMPFSLSFFLTLSAITWFTYGMLLKDIYVALPNILGLIFGVLQMVLYVIYKNRKRGREEHKRPEHIIVVRLSTMGNSGVHPIDTPPNCDENKVDEDQNVGEQIVNKEKSMEASNAQPSECIV